MNVEILLYVYLFVCLSMILFDVAVAMGLNHRDKRQKRVSARFEALVQAQLRCLREGTPIPQKRDRHLWKKLRRLRNLLAFDAMLEKVYEEEPALVSLYFRQAEAQVVELVNLYCKRADMEATYLCWFLRKYRVLQGKPVPRILERLYRLIDAPSIYCRENAMEAIYSIGEPDPVLEALKRLDQGDHFFHGKILTDGLLNYTGDGEVLREKILKALPRFSLPMEVALVNYLRLSSHGEQGKALLDILRDENRDQELRLACLRYFGSHPDEAAYEVIFSLADRHRKQPWVYAAIASTALASYPRARTVERLKDNLCSPDWYVRLNAAKGLERLGLDADSLGDVMNGGDRYASEILRYRLECGKVARV